MVVPGTAMNGKLFRVSLSLHCCDGGDGWVAGSEVDRVAEWKAFLLGAECMIQ